MLQLPSNQMTKLQFHWCFSSAFLSLKHLGFSLNATSCYLPISAQSFAKFDVVSTKPFTLLAVLPSKGLVFVEMQDLLLRYMGSQK